MIASGGSPTEGASAGTRVFRVLVDVFAIAAGVAAMALALGFGHSASALSKKAAGGLDPNLVVVAGTAPSSSGVQAGFPSSSLTTDDVSALANPGFVPDAVAVAPTVGLSDEVTSLTRTFTTDVLGSTATFPAAAGYQVVQGRFLTPTEVQQNARVVVLGQTVVNSLFAGADPVGRNVVIANQSFQVIGTFAPRGYVGAYDRDDLAVMPITTAWQALMPAAGSPIEQILIRADSASGATAAARQAMNTLMNRHDIVNPAQADFTITTQRNLSKFNVQAADYLKRILELSAVVLLIAGAFHLGRLYRFLTPTRQGVADLWNVLPDALLVGVIGGLLGLVAAVIAAPIVHHWTLSTPKPKVTLYGAAISGALGVVAAAVSTVPTLWRSLRRRPDRSEPEEEPFDAGAEGQEPAGYPL